jgi:hypothetical protein
MDGPGCLYFTYQVPFKKSSDGTTYVEMVGAPEEFRVSTGKFPSKFYKFLRFNHLCFLTLIDIGEYKLIGKSVYFAKAIHDKAISKTGINDHEVLFGEVSGTYLYFLIP